MPSVPIRRSICVVFGTFIASCLHQYWRNGSRSKFCCFYTKVPKFHIRGFYEFSFVSRETSIIRRVYVRAFIITHLHDNWSRSRETPVDSAQIASRIIFTNRNSYSNSECELPQRVLHYFRCAHVLSGALCMRRRVTRLWCVNHVNWRSAELPYKWPTLQIAEQFITWIANNFWSATSIDVLATTFGRDPSEPTSLSLWRCSESNCRSGFWPLLVGRGVPHGELSPHAYFASFSITAGPICLKLSQYTPSICPQMVLALWRVSMRTAEVDFRPSPWGSGEVSPCAFCFVLDNHWADLPQTFTVYSQHMPADGIKFSRRSDENCRSWFWGSPWGMGRFPMGNFLPMRISLRSHEPLGRFAPNFYGTLPAYARRWY